MTSNTSRLSRRLLLIGGGASLLSACAGGSIGPQAPRLSIASVAVQRASLNELVLAVGVNAMNPNPLNLPLTAIDVDLDVAGVRLGRGSLPQPVTLPAGGTVQVPMTVRANPINLGLNALPLLQQPTLPYVISGTAIVGGFRIPIPLSRSGTLRLR